MKHPAHRACWALAAAVLAGCSPAGQNMTAPPPAVSVSVPVEREVTDYSAFTGHTAAVESVQVRARVWGYLEKINFKEGDEVKKGQVLFEIDPQFYQATLNQAEAVLKQAEAHRDTLSDVFARDRASPAATASINALRASSRCPSARAKAARKRARWASPRASSTLRTRARNCARARQRRVSLAAPRRSRDPPR